MTIFINNNNQSNNNYVLMEQTPKLLIITNLPISFYKILRLFSDVLIYLLIQTPQLTHIQYTAVHNNILHVICGREIVN